MMWCKILPKYRSKLYGIVSDFDKVRVLAAIKNGTHNGHYVVQARWHGCSNPNYRHPDYKEYIDDSIKDFTGDDLFDAYWIEKSWIEKVWSDFENNKQASKMLSSEY